MINYPGALDTTTQFPQPQGGSLLTNPDHGLLHTNLSLLGTQIEAILGTTPATNLFNAFAAADKPARQQGGTFQQVYAGTLNLFGQGTNSGTQQGGVYSAGTWQNGTWSGTVANNALVNNGTYGNPTIGSISVLGSTNALAFGGAITPSQGSLTDSAGGTITPNAQGSQIYYCVLGTTAGNRTIGTPTNPTGYQQLTLAFKTSGSANGTLVWSSAFRISQDYGTPALGTGVSWNYYNWRYNSIDSKWDFIGQVLNLV